jgi:LPS sulfotransferase NodH
VIDQQKCNTVFENKMTEATQIQAMLERNQVVPVIVLARSRTGSNLLVSLLNSHPQIRVRGEKCSRLAGREVGEVLLEAFSTRSPRVRIAGFKVFYYHPNDDSSETLWQILLGLSGLKVIHLKRENILKTLVSRKIASVEDVWKNKGESQQERSQELPTVRFSEKELADGFAQTRAWENWGEELFQHQPTFSLTYEDLVQQRREMMSRVFAFLGVDDLGTETVLEKQNTRSLHEVIENYEELRSAFTESPWSRFFSD